ncbi:class I SAM-dependent rRNA methyltransferase [candidate division KSB1 bacterium]|nr:class I SAM-dependent rRNA methyltransferase [candidate division KSB1 bacterium]
MAKLPEIRLRRGAGQRLSAGHLWVFSNELSDGFQSCEPGALVRLRYSDGTFAAICTVNPHSLIAARVFSRVDCDIDEGWIHDHLRAAVQLRDSLLGSGGSCRLVYSEADGMPGLIVDRFGDVVAFSALTAGMERMTPWIIDAIQRDLSPRAIVACNDSRARDLEQLPRVRHVIRGMLDEPVWFEQDGIHLLADPLHGQKTGFFHDQRSNRQHLATWCHDVDTVLDLFCYTGGFGLYALRAGARLCTFVDSSEHALELCRQVVERNGWSDRAAFLRADIFEWLKESRERFDVVAVDPPALAKSRATAGAAVRAYRDLNVRAMARVKPNGLLATSSCSGLVTAVNWRGAVEDAAYKARRPLRFIAFGGQAPDHPILATMPETEYLKFAVGIVGEPPYPRGNHE